jgi:hypothetical protein
MVHGNRGGQGSREGGRGGAAGGMIAEGSKTHLSGDHRGPLLHTKRQMPFQLVQGRTNALGCSGAILFIFY